jgi:citrate lyase subunit beta/citryl-CoA lyase
MEGKFFIHPDQVNTANSIKYVDDEELNTMKKVYNKLLSLDEGEFDIIKVDGVIYEKPHIKRITKILRKLREI